MLRNFAASHPRLVWITLVVAVLIAMVLAIAEGAVAIPPQRVLGILVDQVPGVDTEFGASPQEVAIILDVRFPRVITAAVVGMGLALAGAIFQGLLRNPLADPYVIGTAAGAALGATLALLAGAGVFGAWAFLPVPVAAFIGALSAVLIVYHVSRIGPHTPIITLLLAGFAISSVLTAAMAFLWLLNDVTLRRTIYWSMGGLSASGWGELGVVIPIILIAGVFGRLFAQDLNTLLLGEEQAAHLGVEVERRKLTLLILGSLLTAAAVSVSGLIGFVGLVTPHIGRLLFGPDHRSLLPATALLGALLLELADLLSRILLAPQEIPVGIITAILGATFFIYLLRKHKREYVY